MGKKIVYGSEARKLLEKGVDTVANVVKVTLGARGRNVVIEKSWGGPTITNDGVSIAKEIDLENKFENLGAQLVKEVASKTNDVAGDGTTTATVLAQAMIKEGLKYVESGVNPLFLKKGIDIAVSKVVEELHKYSKKISKKEDIVHVATISANDKEIGKLIAEAMDKVGENGVITVEDSKSFETYVEFKEGMQFDRGYISPYFVTDPEKMEVVYSDPYILITNKRLSNVKQLVPLLEKVVQTQKPLLIIADDVEGEVLTTLVVNRLKGILNVVAVKAPDFGEKRNAILQDIAILTGGKVISDEVGITLENITLQDLGKADSIRVTKDETIIVGGKGNPEEIEKRINQIKIQIEQATNDYEKETLQERLAKLAGGVAVIKVGATTETELKEKKFRIEDAIHATKAAIEEGIVPGGGIALLRLREVLKPLLQSEESEIKYGIKVVYDSLKVPTKQICMNAGIDGEVVINNILQSDNLNYGFDVVTEQYVDMLEAGIIDPTKVVRTALQNAASIAGILLTTEVLVVEDDSQKDKNNN